jgi:hypothetical protein
MASADIEISFQDFMNPHMYSEISVELEDKIDKMSLEQIEGDLDSVYRLEIHNLEGFDVKIYSESSSNRKAVNRVVQDLITAINLTTLTGVARREVSRVETPEISYTEEEKSEIGRQLHAEMRTSPNQPISEKEVYDLFQKIKKLEKGHELGSNNIHIVSENSSEGRADLENFLSHKDVPAMVEINLLKSLKMFDGAMASRRKSVQHLLLFVALETATNVKQEKRGQRLNKAMSESSDLGLNYIEQWRELYKRQKHVDSREGLNHSNIAEDMVDLKKLSLAGVTNIGLSLSGMRKAAASAIQKALREHI